jgi:hypothetical protein
MRRHNQMPGTGGGPTTLRGTQERGGFLTGRITLVLEVAGHGRCDRIVTFNTHDFAGSERLGVQVQTPSEFLKSLGGKS